MSIDLPLAGGRWDPVTAARPFLDLSAWLRGQVSESQLCALAGEYGGVSTPVRVRAVVVGARQRFALHRGEVRWRPEDLSLVAPMLLARPAPLGEHSSSRLLDVRAPAEAFFLGVDGADLLVAVAARQEDTSSPSSSAPDGQGPAGLQWADLRWQSHELQVLDRQLLAVAAGLCAWHAGAQFCARCGSRTDSQFAGWQRQCEGCGQVEYPRTDPSVIVAILDGQERLLLAHNRRWRPGYVSLVAGFMEIGESPEQAVARETREEVGLQVERVRYVASQPWPFPRSLMLGFCAQTPDPAALRVDGEEIDWADFYSRQEVRVAVARRELQLPNPISIARVMIESWLTGGDENVLAMVDDGSRQARQAPATRA